MVQFQASVHSQGIQAYVELIHAIRITSCKLVSDLLNADEGRVLKAIRRTDGRHFMAGFLIHTRANSTRTYSPDFNTEEFDDTTNKLICELNLEAAEVCMKMLDIHSMIVILKSQVSAQNFLKIVSAVGLPLTTISVVDPATQEVNVDQLRVRDHMPDPKLLYGDKATQLLGARVRFHMQNILLTTQNVYPMTTCEQEFNVSHTRFERVVSGIKHAGGHEYAKKRKLGPDEMLTGASKPKAKKQNPVNKGQGGLTPKETACKYCDKVCYSDETLLVHINNEHSDRQSVFQCVFCALRFNEFRVYVAHLEKHDKDMYKCYACQKQFDSACELRVHVHMHINQCPLCSRCFESLLVLSKHVNKAHGAALSEEKKQCLYCDAEFESFMELGNHSKQGHHHYFCDVCFVGFISEPLLVEHHVNDHPTG